MPSVRVTQSRIALAAAALKCCERETSSRTKPISTRESDVSSLAMARSAIRRDRAGPPSGSASGARSAAPSIAKSDD